MNKAKDALFYILCTSSRRWFVSRRLKDGWPVLSQSLADATLFRTKRGALLAANRLRDDEPGDVDATGRKALQFKVCPNGWGALRKCEIMTIRVRYWLGG